MMEFYMVPIMGNQLKSLREQRGWTQERTAEEFQMSKSGYVKLERSERKLTDAHIAKARRLYGVGSAEIVGDADVPTRSVPVMGKIGAGGDIDPDFEQVPEDGLYAVEVPFPLPGDMIALEVNGDSMLPRYDHGDIVIVWREQKRPTDAFIGTEVAVLTAAGKRYLKKLQRSGSHYNLLSWNANPIENVVPKWIGEIYIVVRGAQVRRGWAGR